MCIISPVPYRALDLYCGAGGATRGLQQAGFNVTGVDAQPQPRYVGDNFITKNVLDLEPAFLREFDLVIASPPCQAYSPITKGKQGLTVNGLANGFPDLIPPTRELLKASGVPYIIENVAGAPLEKWIMLCGTMFSTLRVIRHRWFETNLRLNTPGEHPEHPKVHTYDKRKAHHGTTNEWENFVQVAGMNGNYSLGAAADAMQIGWMTKKEISQAIPPAYTKFLGEQVVKILDYRRT